MIVPGFVLKLRQNKTIRRGYGGNSINKRSDGEIQNWFLHNHSNAVQRKKSPAFRAGKNWRVDEDDFKKFLQERSAKYKG